MSTATAEERPSNKLDADIFTQTAHIGQYVSVEILNKHRDRFKSSLIGAKFGKYLVLEAPSVIHYGNMRDQLRLGQSIIIRTICEKTTGDCVGFISNVEGLIKEPKPVFFVTYPQEVEKRELRAEKRQETRISAVMMKTEGAREIEGVITDLSRGGCCFELEVDEAIKGLKVTNMLIRFDDPETNVQVVRQAKVCSQRREGNRIAIGFAFSA